jgi:YVTN family beta-propeller protein
MKKLLLISVLFTFSFSLSTFNCAAQTAYITNYNDNTVSVINVETNTIVDLIPVQSGPWSVAASPDGSKVFISNIGSNIVSVINTATDTIMATISVGSDGISVSPDGSKVYVTYGFANSVSVINTVTDTVLATISVGVYPKGISVSPDGSKVYVANENANSVSVINTSSNTVTATIPVGVSPEGIAISPDGSKVYVTNSNSNSVSVINTSTDTVTVTIPVGTYPIGISVTPDGSKVYVANFNSYNLSVINTSTGIVTATIPGGNHPYGVSVSQDGINLYVVDYYINMVQVINTTTNTAMAYIAVGQSPVAFGNFISPHKVLPKVSITASVNPVCIGSSTTLTAIGATSYAWSDSLGASNTVVVTPTATTTYTVTGTTSTGTDSASITININTAIPVANISASANPTCAGHYTILTASGGSNYTWCNSLGNSNQVVVSPTVSTTYTVTVSTNLCSSSASISLAVIPAVNINISAYPQQICVGDSSQINVIASGGSTSYYTYSWSSSPTGFTSIVQNPVVKPTVTTTYIVTVTGGNCSAVSSVVFNVHPQVSISISQICSGTGTTFTATPTNGGTAPVYKWMVNGIIAGTNSSTFTSASLSNGDLVTCLLTSSIPCATGNPATSNAIIASIMSQPNACQNSDFLMGDFTDWAGSVGDNENSAGLGYSAMVSMINGTPNDGPYIAGQ